MQNTQPQSERAKVNSGQKNLSEGKSEVINAHSNTKRNQSSRNGKRLIRDGQFEEEQAEALKKEEKEKQKDLDTYIKEYNRNILHLKSTFPFQLFPDELIVDQNKVTFINSYFFSSKQVRNVLIDDSGDVMIETGPIFSTLYVLDKSMGNVERDDTKITHISKNQALEARKLIQGLILCKKENIDLNKLTDKEIREKVEKLGRATEV